MARNQGILDEGRERFEGALKDMERDWKRITKRADQNRKQFERRAQREVKKFRTELRKNPIVKRAARAAEKGHVLGNTALVLVRLVLAALTLVAQHDAETLVEERQLA